jgi:hypothetical protein
MLPEDWQNALCVSMIPFEVQDMIYEYLHHLRMKDTAALIVQGGISTFEDLPDLIDMMSIPIVSDREGPGWSKRVSEFKNNLGAVIL